MGRRIALSYTIDMDDLEQEVQRLYFNVTDSLDTVVRQLKKPECLLSVEGYDNIDAIRRQLADFDVKLHDINLIINGWLSHQVEMNKRNHVEDSLQDEDAT